ncbi:VOC family protein [Planctomicrobium piriforme]|uniref:Catechol 2,3-dioxygenase n=1 Tax=Planctomicrobium piriforme TaxID=1576369 RepID=A0A1I3FB47_9PLAN|nr:VOC family protein [Planctomicrobium piriforme]SFI08458.1 Catechol 2,3-dioxygenase [Planctomicrobium piriforme]
MRLHELILYVSDMPRQVAFYRDLLGLRLLEPLDITDFSGQYWVVFDAGGCFLALHGGGNCEFGEDAPKFVFLVADIEAERRRLSALGVPVSEIRSPATGVLVCDARDPEGNSFSLEQVPPRAAISP